MDKRKKQLMKRIEGLEAQKEKHLWKIDNLAGGKDTTHDYWKKEIERMEEEIRELKERVDD